MGGKPPIFFNQLIISFFYTNQRKQVFKFNWVSCGPLTVVCERLSAVKNRQAEPLALLRIIRLDKLVDQIFKVLLLTANRGWLSHFKGIGS